MKTEEAISTEELNEIKTKKINGWKRHVKITGDARSLANMATVAQKDLSVADSSFDADSSLICLANGEYDLNNYKFSPFRSESFLTRQANYSYDPTADCPNWKRFLSIIFFGDTDLIDYIQRCVGYSFTDDISENAFFIAHGDGSNGKSTFVNTIRHGMGSYASTTPIQTLMAKRNETIPNDVARLRSLRLVTTAETESARVLDTAMVKQFTSSDPITARFLQKEFFEFKPTFKIFLCTNHIPTVKDMDGGTWRRIKLIPFNYKFEGANKILDYEQKYLFPEFPGIFNWAVEVLRKWRVDGLKEPKVVLEATKAYQVNEDTIGSFVEEYLIKDNMYYTLRSDLWRFYNDVMDMDHIKAFGKKNFLEKMSNQGFRTERLTKGANKGKHAFNGIKCVDVVFPARGDAKGSPEAYSVASDRCDRRSMYQ